MYKAYKFRMYPNNEQRNKLNSFIGTSRFIYNYYLDKKISMYKELKTTYSLKDMKKDLVPLQEEYEWLKDCDSCILRTSLEDLDSAYESFLKQIKDFLDLNQEEVEVVIEQTVLEVHIKIVAIQI